MTAAPAPVPAGAVDQPWLSVVVPLYQGARYLEACLESVVAALRAEPDARLEILIADDGSTDDGPAIARGFADRLPLRMLDSVRLGSWVATTNRAVAAATGEWVCFLHQDDLWRPDRLSVLRTLTPGADLVLTSTAFVGSGGEPLGSWRLPWRSTAPATAEIRRRLYVQNFLSVPSACMRRSTLLAAGPLDVGLWYTADWDLWFRLAGSGRVRSSPEQTVAFRVHDASQTQQGSKDSADYREQLETVLERYASAVAGPRSRAARAAGRASLELNVALAGSAHGGRPPLGPLLRALAASATPPAMVRLARDSRLWERVTARLRARRIPAGDDAARSVGTPDPVT